MQQTTQYMYLTLLVVFKYVKRQMSSKWDFCLLLIDMIVQAYIPVDDNTIRIMMNLKYKKKHNCYISSYFMLTHKAKSR